MHLICHWTFLLLLPLTVSGCATNAAGEDETITYGCDEVVAVGRVGTTGYTDLSTGDDFLGRGRYDMLLNIKRVLRGEERRRVVPVGGYFHSEMREDADFWLVLRPTPGGGYAIRTGNLVRFPYRLARTCSEGPLD
jgi:hypothetical protein